MKLLYLLRHAKSSWSDPDLRDLDRPLAPRGRRATAALAGHLRRADIQPALVLCSPARRTIETFERIASAFDTEVTLLVDDELYGSSAEELMHRLRDLPETLSSVMVIGHNPVLQTLAVLLAGGGEPSALERLRAKLPTGALATLAIPDDSWRAIEPGRARLVGFVTPKELA
ncbi:MAG TPA: histidine phosphatase family protein [Acidimicrobiia bacterium]|jgi:phosphohistidine phosphatase